MIKLSVFVLAIFCMSCGNNGTSDNKSTTDPSNVTSESKDPDAAKGLELISKSDCFTCHKLNETGIGPSYAAVAAKYKTINPASMDSMVHQIINGGVGKWGTVPMAPHMVTKENAQLMVHYIMSIKP